MGIKRVAIVGGGISGIASLWNLQDDIDEVHLFETEPRLGGHANTAVFKGLGGHTATVDTGFIALNEQSYRQSPQPLELRVPQTNALLAYILAWTANFCAFLESLNVSTVPTDMSFSVSQDNGAFEWCSKSVSGFLSRGSNLFRPFFWRMVFDILRFNYFATDSLFDGSESEYSSFEPEYLRRCTKSTNRSEEDESIGKYLDREGYSESFKNKYLIPMVAAPWCIDPKEFCCNFPARPLIRFMYV